MSHLKTAAGCYLGVFLSCLFPSPQLLNFLYSLMEHCGELDSLLTIL